MWGTSDQQLPLFPEGNVLLRLVECARCPGVLPPSKAARRTCQHVPWSPGTPRNQAHCNDYKNHVGLHIGSTRAVVLNPLGGVI